MFEPHPPPSPTSHLTHHRALYVICIPTLHPSLLRASLRSPTTTHSALESEVRRPHGSDQREVRGEALVFAVLGNVRGVKVVADGEDRLGRLWMFGLVAVHVVVPSGWGGRSRSDLRERVASEGETRRRGGWEWGR